MQLIPKSLLKSTAKVRVPVDTTGLGGKFAEPVVLKGVYYEPMRQIAQSSYQLQDSPKGTLFVDAANTEGAFDVPAGSLVSIDGGEESAVLKSSAYTANGRMHHWELQL